MSEQNIKKFYETLARIISEREQVKITVSVSKKKQHKDKKTDDRCERSSLCQSVSVDMFQTKNIISNPTRKSNSKTTGKVGKTKGFRRFCRPCNRY